MSPESPDRMAVTTKENSGTATREAFTPVRNIQKIFFCIFLLIIKYFIAYLRRGSKNVWPKVNLKPNEILLPRIIRDGQKDVKNALTTFFD